MKEWWNKFKEDVEERYTAEFDFIAEHPVIGTFFFDMKWLFIVYFSIILIMAYATGKQWDLVERES